MEYFIESNGGFLVLYDGNNQLFVNFNWLAIGCIQSSCKTQGEYVIFHDKHIKVALYCEEICDHCEDYDDLSLDTIEDPVIVLHTKYIQKLHADSRTIHLLGFEPTKHLELDLKDMSKFEVRELEKYVSSHSLNHLHVKLHVCLKQ